MDDVDKIVERLQKAGNDIPFSGHARDIVDADGDPVDYGEGLETFVPIPPRPAAEEKE